MKRKIFYVTLFCFVMQVFVSCIYNRDPIIETLSDLLDTDYLCNYFPYQKDQQLLFTNSTDDSLILTVKEIGCTEELCDDKVQYYTNMEKYGSNSWAFGVCLYYPNKGTFGSGVEVHSDYIPYKKGVPVICIMDNYLSLKSEESTIEEINAWFMDEMIIYNEDGSVHSKCVNGIGITEFTDDDNVKWYCQGTVE